MFRRIKNLWRLSDINPDLIGFKWTDTKKSFNQNMAIVIEDDAPDMFPNEEEQ